MIGIPNAAVFPVPVCANAIKSVLFSNKKGIASVWISVVVIKFNSNGVKWLYFHKTKSASILSKAFLELECIWKIREILSLEPDLVL